MNKGDVFTDDGKKYEVVSVTIFENEKGNEVKRISLKEIDN